MSTTHLVSGSDLVSFEHRDESVQGARHNTNEDSRGVHLLHGRSEPDPRGVVFAIADGATGRPGGERASEIAIQAVGRACRDTDPLELVSEGAREAFLRRAFDEAQHAIEREAAYERGLETMATTLSIALVIGHDVAVGCVGDSPAWLWNGQTLEALETGGRPGTPGAMLGANNGRPAPVFSHRRLAIGDQFLLATDGLAEVAGNDELVRVCRLEDVGKAVEQLSRRAKEGQAPDDVTLMLVRFAGREPRPHAIVPVPAVAQDATPRYASIPEARRSPETAASGRGQSPQRGRAWRVDPVSLVVASLVVAGIIIAGYFYSQRQQAARVEPVDLFALPPERSGEVLAVDSNTRPWVVAERLAESPASVIPITSEWLNVQFPTRRLRLEYVAAESAYVTPDRRHAYRIEADSQRHLLYMREVPR